MDRRESTDHFGNSRSRGILLAVLALAVLAAGRWWWVASDPGPATAVGPVGAVGGPLTGAGTAIVPGSGVPVGRVDPVWPGRWTAFEGLAGSGRPGFPAVPASRGEILRRETGQLRRSSIGWPLPVRQELSYAVWYSCDGPVETTLVLRDGGESEQWMTVTCDGRITHTSFTAAEGGARLTLRRDPNRVPVEFQWLLVER